MQLSLRFCKLGCISIFLQDFVEIVKFEIYTNNFAKIHFSNGIVSEREKNTALRVRKEVNLMELSPSRQKTIRHQFDSFCKKILREEYRDCMREVQRRMRHELSFSALSSHETEQLYVMNEYPSDRHYFSVLGYDIAVEDELVSRALSTLPSLKRDIILLSYFLDMTDQEIGDILHLVRRTVQYQRINALKQLKEMLEEKREDE